MDSLTQIVLGASVGEAVLGKKVGNKAIFWGAIAGTIPDLDVILRSFTDEISATQMHRGFSHSIVFAVLIAPLLGWIAKKIHFKLKDVSFKDWTKLFFWATVTHPLLDAHTTWGTQFFWPFNYRLAYQNIFVVDPFYTLPFLGFLIISMSLKKENPRRSKFNNIGLSLSSTYLILTLVFKWVSFQEFKQGLENQKIEYVEMDTKPSPLNAILWSSLIETDKGYRTAYYSLLDKQEITYSKEFLKNHHLLEPYLDQKVIKQLIDISAGWYKIEEKNGKLLFWDLRFGQMGMDVNNASFLWYYELNIDETGNVTAVKRQPEIKNFKMVFKELFNRIKGN
ncbi:MAG: metal-dependent hydrolase [Flavobacteriales bacterium]|nr:metal-dependent hydrolase [Flavobacteriales bacterium]